MNNKISFTQNGRFYYGWYLAALGFILMFIGYVALASTMSLFVIPVTEELGIDRATFMVCSTVMGLVGMFAAYPAGKILAKYNLRIVLGSTCVLSFLALFLVSRATSVLLMYVAYGLIGVTFTFITTIPISIIINNWFGGKIRGTAIGLAFIGSGLGGMVLLPIVNGIITEHGWRTGYFTLGMAFLVILLPLVLIFAVRKPEDKGFTRMGQTSEESQVKQAESGMTMGEAKKTPMFWCAFLSTGLVPFTSGAILFNSVPYFIECGFDAAKAASLGGMLLGGLVIGKPLLGVIVDRLGAKFGVVFSTIVFGCTFVSLYMMTHNQHFVYLALFCYGIGGANITMAPPLMINKIFGEKDYGAILGMLLAAQGFGGAFGGIFAAKIYDVTGSYAAFWIVGACVMVLAVIMRVIAFTGAEKRKLQEA